MTREYTGMQTQFKDLSAIEEEAANLVRRSDYEEEIIKDNEAILQMEYAYGWANRCCHAERRKVGSVIYKNRSPLSCGYNGTPAGEPNCCEYKNDNGDLVTKPHVIHAEANAFDKLATEGSSIGTKNASLFVTTAPCLDCAMRIHNCKITTVYFTEIYRGVEGLEHLIKHGVTIKHIDMLKEEIYTIYQSEANNDLNRKVAAIDVCRSALEKYEDGKYHKIINKAIV
jgi:dCMP deaminase